MPLSEKTITCHYVGDEITITVVEADLKRGFARGRLQSDLVLSVGLDDKDVDLANALWIYCDLVAATASVDGMEWPMEPETFCEKADRWFHHVGNPWLAAVRELNPHWLPTYEGDGLGEIEAVGG
jgi:hypothetical protein